MNIETFQHNLQRLKKKPNKTTKKLVIWLYWVYESVSFHRIFFVIFGRWLFWNVEYCHFLVFFCVFLDIFLFYSFCQHRGGRKRCAVSRINLFPFEENSTKPLWMFSKYMQLFLDWQKHKKVVFFFRLPIVVTIHHSISTPSIIINSMQFRMKNIFFFSIS